MSSLLQAIRRKGGQAATKHAALEAPFQTKALASSSGQGLSVEHGEASTNNEVAFEDTDLPVDDELSYSGFFRVINGLSQADLNYAGGLQKSKVLVILVHGIGGHWQKSWEFEGFNWVKGFLKPDLEDAGFVADIWSYGYDSRTSTNSVANIEDVAIMLLDHISGLGNTYPIVFVAHSLGGLVVKKTTILAHTDEHQYGEFLRRIRGCVFLGVPHRGADNTWWKTLPGKLMDICTIGTKGNVEFARSVERKSRVWKDIANGFVPRTRNLLTIHSFYETKKVGPVLVVDRESAVIGVANESVHSTDSDHVMINKFRRDERQRYQLVGNAIRDLIKRVYMELGEPLPDDGTGRHLCSDLPMATDTFCGRVTELSAIADALKPTRLGRKGIVLYGIGGSGKTQLTLRYIEAHRQNYKAIIWIDASTIERTNESFAEAASIISSGWPGRDLPLVYSSSSNWKKVVARLRSTRHRDWLLVIDSVDDLTQQNFIQYIPSCNYGSVIVTSTQSEAPDVFKLAKLEVDSLDSASGRKLLFARALSSTTEAEISEDDSKHATAIAKELSNLPLAIEQAGRLLSKGIATFPNFIERYREHYGSLMKKSPPPGVLAYEKEGSVFTVFSMLFNSVKSRSPEAAALLTFIAILGPSQIPMSLIDHLRIQGTQNYTPSDEDTTALSRALSDSTHLSLALDCLVDSCLVKLKRNHDLSCRSFSLHRAICQWCIVELGPRPSWAIKGQASRRLFFAPLKHGISLIEKHIPAENLKPPEGEFSSVYASISAQLAQLYLYEGQLGQAKKYFLTAVEYEMTQQDIEWPSSERHVSLLHGLGIANHRLRDWEKAEELFKSALVLSKNLFGEMDSRTTFIYSSLKKTQERSEVMLEHHKAGVVAATGPKMIRETQELLSPENEAPENNTRQSLRGSLEAGRLIGLEHDVQIDSADTLG
ncbi:hypothetical protein AOQ84DRAFT_230809, partial [Glonium stellatum]